MARTDCVYLLQHPDGETLVWVEYVERLGKLRAVGDRADAFDPFDPYETMDWDLVETRTMHEHIKRQFGGVSDEIEVS